MGAEGKEKGNALKGICEAGKGLQGGVGA